MNGPLRQPSWAPRQADHVLGLVGDLLGPIREGQPADRLLHARIGGDRRLGSRDRRLLGDALFAYLRWFGCVGALPLDRGICAAWWLEGLELQPAIACLFERGGLSVPGDAVGGPHERLRVFRDQNALELPDIDGLLPAWWREESAHLGPWSDRIAEFLRRPPTWLRADRHRQPDLHSELLAAGAVWAGEASPLSYAFRDPGAVREILRRHPDALEIQDLHSQQVVRVASPCEGESWWDACCGAGGKSLQLLDHANRRLDLTCTDRRESVLREVVERGRRHGLGKVRRYALDLLHAPELPNLRFDGILVDAPCAGVGTWARNPDAPLRTSHADVRQSARRQLQMLHAVLPVLRVGGRLVYATCSPTYRESLGVVEDLLRSDSSLSLRPFPHPLTGAPTSGTLTFSASENEADGMFVAVFQKGG